MHAAALSPAGSLSPGRSRGNRALTTPPAFAAERSCDSSAVNPAPAITARSTTAGRTRRLCPPRVTPDVPVAR